MRASSVESETPSLAAGSEPSTSLQRRSRSESFMTVGAGLAVLPPHRRTAGQGAREIQIQRRGRGSGARSVPCATDAAMRVRSGGEKRPEGAAQQWQGGLKRLRAQRGKPASPPGLTRPGHAPAGCRHPAEILPATRPRKAPACPATRRIRDGAPPSASSRCEASRKQPHRWPRSFG